MLGKISGIALLAALSIQAAPHWGERVELTQPDGSRVPVLVWGDEFYQRVESLDSLVLLRDTASGWIEYARLSDDSSQYVSTGVRYNGLPSGAVAGRALALPKQQQLSAATIEDLREQTRKNLFPEGAFTARAAREFHSGVVAGRSASQNSVKGLTILVDFTDARASIGRQAIDDLFNKVGYNANGNNGSVYDFYKDVSNGNLLYTNTVVEYIRAARPKSYYNNASLPSGARARELVQEMISALDARGFDFSTLTSDENGYILAINVLYAGNPDVGWARGLWPHMGGIGPLSVDGRRINVYQITNIGSAPTIGTLCHENGHMVMHWPDLYDYGYQSQGTGQYDLMSAGHATNPQPPGPWLRDIAGWETTTNLQNVATGSRLAVPANRIASYKYVNPLNSKEMFYIESRRKTGRSAMLPDEGVLIWHVDEMGSNNYEQRTPNLHYKVSLEQADGKFDLERGKYTGFGDAFRGGYKDAFSDITVPNSKWWNGKVSGFRVGGISALSDTMSFVWNGGNTVPWLDAIAPGAVIAGLDVYYHEGSWDTLPKFSSMVPLRKVAINQLNLEILGRRSANFAAEYDGYYNALTEGVYEFSLQSDDDAQLLIDGYTVIQKSGSATGTGKVALAKGYHRIRLSLVQPEVRAGLQLLVTVPGGAPATIPASQLSRNKVSSYFMQSVAAPSLVNGLNFKYFEGSWSLLPNMDSITASQTGSATLINTMLPISRLVKGWGVQFKGYLRTDRTGVHTFYLRSADGSKLWIDDKLVINNDGVHAAKEVAAAVALYPGYHSIKVGFFNRTNTATLGLSWIVPGYTKVAVPATVLFREPGFQSAPDPQAQELPVTELTKEVRVFQNNGTLSVRMPTDISGSVEIELRDASGNLLSSTRSFVTSESGNVLLNRAKSRGILLLHVKSSQRNFSSKIVVP